MCFLVLFSRILISGCRFGTLHRLSALWVTSDASFKCPPLWTSRLMMPSKPERYPCILEIPNSQMARLFSLSSLQKTLYDFVYADQELANQELGPKLLELWDRLTAKDQPDVVAAATEEANQHFLALTEFPAVMTIGRPQSGEIRRYLRARKK